MARYTGTKDAVGDVTESFSATKTTAYGSKAPVTSKILAELYGRRIEKMQSLTITAGAAMQEGDGVWLPGEATTSLPVWRCVSVLTYTGSSTALIERR